MKKERFTIFGTKPEEITEFEEFASWAIFILVSIAVIIGLFPWLKHFYNFTTF